MHKVAPSVLSAYFSNLQRDIEMELARLQIELNSPSFYFKMVELRRGLLRQKLVNKASKEELSLLKDIIGLDHLMQEKFGVALN